MNKPRPTVLLFIALFLGSAILVVTMRESAVGPGRLDTWAGQKASALQLASLAGEGDEESRAVGTDDPRRADLLAQNVTGDGNGEGGPAAPATKAAPESEKDSLKESPPRVATIDFQRVIDTHADTLIEKEKLEKLRQAALAEEQPVIDELKGKEVELEQLSKVLNSGVLRGPKREEKLAEARTLQDELDALDNRLRALIDENARFLVAAERKAYAGVSLKIRKHLTPKLAREGYDYLIRMSEDRDYVMRGAAVVVSPEAVDITDEVIAELNAKGAGESAPSSE